MQPPDALKIPAFLRRPNANQGAQPMQKQDSKPTEDAATSAENHRRKRNYTALPSSLQAANGTIYLEGMPLPQLASLQEEWKQRLADVPRIALELRAINAEIRKRAR